MDYDVSGEAGNAFVILGRARNWAQESWGDDWEKRWLPVIKEAKSGDYKHLLKTIVV